MNGRSIQSGAKADPDQGRRESSQEECGSPLQEAETTHMGTSDQTRGSQSPPASPTKCPGTCDNVWKHLGLSQQGGAMLLASSGSRPGMLQASSVQQITPTA